MKTIKWKDLKFNKHHIWGSGGVQCRIDFDNGEWCSIIGGDKGFYGDGVTTFEIMSSSTKKRRNTVKGWLTKAQVLRHLNYLNKKESK